MRDKIGARFFAAESACMGLMGKLQALPCFFLLRHRIEVVLGPVLIYADQIDLTFMFGE